MSERMFNRIVALYILICSVHCQDGTKSSLTFVIDNTVSMAYDIRNIIQGADRLLDAAVNSDKSEIEDFVLVTFNDPGFELVVKTSTKEEFTNSLRKIRGYGGGDCPEMTMSGIELGLKSSRPFSDLFVFTDFTAKDMDKYDIVKNLALNLNIKIHFIITHIKCSVPNPDFTAYQTLASATGGDFFIMKKRKIPKILNYVKRLTESKKIEIIRRRFKSNEKKEVEVTLDSYINDVLVAVTGDNPVINVSDKRNATIPTEYITDIRNTKIIAWNNTEPGTYHISFNTKNTTEDALLVIQATSKISFSYGFSVVRPEFMNETTNRPVADQKSYILIKLKTESDNINLERINIVDLEDKLLLDKPLFAVRKEDQCYISEPIDFPKETFKIKIIAESKEVIKRTSLPIEPQKA